MNLLIEAAQQRAVLPSTFLKNGTGSAPQSHDANHERALKIILTWIKADADSIGAQFLTVPGVSDLEAASLTRLAALIAATIDPAEVPSTLVTTLGGAVDVPLPPEVVESFDVLRRENAISNLATLYARTIAAPHRRALGTFFTPRAEAESMVQEYADRFSAPTHVVDIGAGVGVFSHSAREMWPDASISAIDINPITLGLQAVALRYDPNPSATDLFLADYSSWLAEFKPSGPTLYLGNPPYTRWQSIPADLRSGLLGVTGGLVGVRANLSTLFLAMTLRRMRPEDGLCLIVPAGWMGAQYARKLRAFVREQNSRQITLRLADSWRFDNAIVDAVVIEVGPEEADPNASLTLTDWPQSETLSLARLTSDQSPFPRSPGTVKEANGSRNHGARLGEIASISRGVATGANEFFIVRDAAESGIGTRWLTGIVRRIRPGTGQNDLAVQLSHILNLKEYVPGVDEAIDARIKEAVGRGLDKRYLCTKRRRWFDLSHELHQPDVIISALGRDRFHVYPNAQNYGITNNLFGLRWRADVTGTQKRETIDWLRSAEGQRAMLDSATVEADGLRRLSPRALGEIFLPADASPIVPYVE